MTLDCRSSNINVSHKYVTACHFEMLQIDNAKSNKCFNYIIMLKCCQTDPNYNNNIIAKSL